MVLTPARDTESDTESLVLGGKSCKMWKLQPEGCLLPDLLDWERLRTTASLGTLPEPITEPKGQVLFGNIVRHIIKLRTLVMNGSSTWGREHRRSLDRS